MKKSIILLATMALGLGLSGTAFAIPVCHRILAKDHVSIGVKGHAGIQKFFQKPSQVIESPFLPTGKWTLPVNVGKEVPLRMTISNPEICGTKIKYQVHLVYKGKLLYNKDQSIKPNRWSLLYANKAEHIYMLIKAVHKI
jgi:hypothetical protein